jgi:predicted metal-binding protein
MSSLVDITNQRFGRLVALTYAQNRQMWNCICDCGNYGGRGIAVHPSWDESYKIFLAYLLATIGRRPSPKHSLDRINNDGNYEPGNVKWSTQKEQMKTRRQIGSFWDPEARQIAQEKGRRSRWG